MPLGVGRAFVTDEAQTWIALTPTVVRYCRNAYCLQHGLTLFEVSFEKRIFRIKQNHEENEGEMGR